MSLNMSKDCDDDCPCKSEPDDMLVKMFSDQDEIMKLLQQYRNFPAYPLDLEKKDSQQRLKEVAFECMGELHEAVKELRNAKKHRATDVKEFDRAKFVEELADTQHYLNEILILADVSAEEFFEAYMAKGKIVRDRCKTGY